MDLSALAHMDPSTLRMVLPGYLSGHIADPDRAATNLARCTDLVANWSDEDCQSVIDALATGGDGYRVFEANPFCRSLSREWSHDAILDPHTKGLEYLRAAAEAGPTIVLCNHFSYYDATATDALVAWAGAPDLADRMLFAAGPKVYTHLFRRVAAACLNTVKVPQSTKLAHTSRLTVRELALQARSSLDATQKAVVEDRLILVLYPEGTRTRDGRMQPFLKGVRRYLAMGDGMSVVPAAITGTDRLMSVSDDERIAPSAVRLTFCPPLRVGPDGSAKDVLVATRNAIAEVLPDDHKPDPETPAVS